MTTLSPRIQPLFDKTKSVCFGRFLIDVPDTAAVVWGPADVPLGVDIHKSAASRLSEVVHERELALKAEPRFPTSKKLSLYFETLDGALPEMKHVISQQDFSSTGMLRIDSYYAMGPHLVQLGAQPLEEDKSSTIDDLNGIARRLRPRSEAEAPAEPGVCIDQGFLPDDAGKDSGSPRPEHIRIGFRLEEFPDVHLSIYLAPSNPHDPDSDSLERQIGGGMEAARNAGQSNPFLALKIFRQAKREIHDWTTGYEILTKTPDEAVSHAHHDFWLKFTGVPHDVLKPYADIEFKTGVDRDSAGVVRPTLTDEEAVAVWDKLTGSIRVRPSNPVTKTSEFDSARLPLGTLAATGRDCPQTGWWQCEQEVEVQGGRRQFFRAGERMPHVICAERQGFWQKLMAQPATVRSATMWTLADYEASPDAGAAPPAARQRRP